MALALRHLTMKSDNLYKQVYSIKNLIKAWEKARKGKITFLIFPRDKFN